MCARHQRGAVLLLSMVLLVLLGLLGVLSIHASTQQTRMASNLVASMQALEMAENLLRMAEARLPGADPGPCRHCLPPSEAVAGWQQVGAGRYLIQNLGETDLAFGMPKGLSVTLFRITAIAEERQARIRLESVVAWSQSAGQEPVRRILWRQIPWES